MNVPSLSTIPLAFLNALARIFAKDSYVRTGLTLTATGAGSLSVTVASGTAVVNNTYVSYAGGTVTPGASSATQARYDLIVILSGAAVPSVVAGTAADAPVPPALAAGALLLGLVYIGPTATDYTSTSLAFIADYNAALDQYITTRGDLLRAGANGVPERVALGASGRMLSSDGTDAVWGQGPLTTNGDLLIGQTTGTPARLAAGSVGDMLYVSATGTLAWRTAPDLYNLLTNPGFEIWQRGAGAFTTAVYCADRWRIIDITAGTISVAREGTDVDTGSSYSLSIVGAGGGIKTVGQYIEMGVVSLIAGRAVTFSVRVKTATASAIRLRLEDSTGGTYGSYHTGGGGWETLTVTRTIGATTTMPICYIYMDTNATAYIDNATLVIGSTAQAYYPLHPADEWERCERYYEVSDAVNGTPFWQDYFSAAELHSWGGFFATKKAAVPTATKSGTWALSGVGAQPVLNPGGIAQGTKSFSIGCTSSGAGTGGFNPNGTDDILTFEANP